MTASIHTPAPTVQGPPKAVCVFLASAQGYLPGQANEAAAKVATTDSTEAGRDSSAGSVSPYVLLAREAGERLAKNNVDIVYGGSRLGCMGALAGGCLGAGGRVIGVIPKFFESMGVEPAPTNISELHIVTSMHERKQMMTNLSDAFLVLPGGLGTLDELFETITWRALGVHAKPIVILNYEGFYDHILAYVKAASERGMIKVAAWDEGVIVVNTLDEAMDALMSGRGRGTRIVPAAADSIKQ
ncbi:hypothetical protein H696_03389 [Fonticula alba]|uniref:Cytokinin riboside 5'-monophosphate phosphoribohydrolase n=1 Tax=Fonticula alba TaxID=691883 RepID=A0A058Z6M2_FONAL|nr:hypothetical protein H696_03389 [Fonticula alba]KCV69924.1 hypothetical protein H696_03389 [Fonticula alba]|eukprot:XP_009495530.1 hypothetical protein H696_03389 [Fonticula alba]